MPNITRNDLCIIGQDVKCVLEFIGFNPNGIPVTCGTDVRTPNLAILIDFNRIVPKPATEPPQGWREWCYGHWGTVKLYDGYMDGDIFELSDNQAAFKFYTEWTSAYKCVRALAQRFAEFRFRYSSCDTTNHSMGEVIWEKGYPVVFAPMYDLKVRDDVDAPVWDPITEEITTTAKSLVEAAQQGYSAALSVDEDAVDVVANAMASSGKPVRVELRPNKGGGVCLTVHVDDEEKKREERQAEQASVPPHGQ